MKAGLLVSESELLLVAWKECMWEQKMVDMLE